MASACTICDSSNAKFCTKCHSAKYCSPECQQTDWPSHSLLCSQYSTHTGRPDESHSRAILFPPNEIKPKFVWIECRTVEDDERPGTTFELSQEREYLGGRVGQYDAHREMKLIQRNILRNRDLPNTLQVTCRETFLIDGSQLNQSIVKATHGAAAHTWKGPIVALKKQGLGMDPKRFMDIDMQDYRDVVDYFISYGDESVQDGDVARDRRGKIRGVKINCKGDQRTFGAETYSAVDVPESHPVFYNAIAPISALVGMSVHTSKYPPDRLWNNWEGHSYENVPATFLHLESDLNCSQWGWALMHWQDGVGSVLVVRSDGRDVTTHQAEALSRFCQFKMQPLFEHGFGGGLVEMTKAEVMGFLTPEAFRDYFAEVRARKMEKGKGEGWETARSPV